MKKVFLLLMVFPYIFISCSSDDEYDTEFVQSKILGTWVMDHCMDEDGKYIKWAPSEIAFRLTFHQDGKCLYDGYGFFEGGENGKYTVEGDILKSHGAGSREINLKVLHLDDKTIEIAFLDQNLKEGGNGGKWKGYKE